MTKPTLADSVTLLLVVSALVVSGLVVNANIETNRTARLAREGLSVKEWNTFIEQDRLEDRAGEDVIIAVFADYTCSVL